MIKRMLLSALVFLSLMLFIPAHGLGNSIVVTTDQSGYSSYDGSNPSWGEDGSFSMTTGKSGYYSNYPGGYPGMQQTGYDTSLVPINAEQQSPESLTQYQEFYSFDQKTQTQSGPVQFDIYRSEPTYLIINGQSQPYNSNFVPDNSLWIQGTTRWTQYMQCPINARFKLLAFSQGGPATVVELYPNNGYQTVNNYQFYPGYTQFSFWADVVGRHTLNFYTNGQKSNSVVVDVVPYSGTYNGPYNGVVQNPVGPSTTRTVSISIGVTGQGATETPQGNPQQPETSGTGNQGSGQTTSGGQESGCPCLGEKCICGPVTCENGKTFPQWYGKVVDKKTDSWPSLVEGKCYCDCNSCDTCGAYHDFVESQCGEVAEVMRPVETSCSASGVDSNNIEGGNVDVSAPGTTSTDSQDQGFMSDVPQGEAI